MLDKATDAGTGGRVTRKAPKRERFVRIPQAWLHALGLYGRLTGLERSVLDVLVHHVWGWEGRAQASLGFQDFLDRLPGRTPEGVRRALIALKTPASQVYTWGNGRHRREKPGHGLIRVEREHTRRREAVLAIETDWRRWGWENGTDLEGVARTLAQYAVEEVHEWSQDAEHLAQALRTVAIDGLGPLADVPLPQPQDRTWQRWCLTFERILRRGYSVELVVRCLQFAHEDAWFSKRIRGPKADLRLRDDLDSLVMRSDPRARGRWTS